MSGSAPGEKKPPRRGSLAWWVAEHQPPASVAVMSRRRWLLVVKLWVKSPAGRAVLKTARIRPETFLVVTEVIARQCTGSTGRNVGVTNALLAATAGRSEVTVTRVRKVLLEQGFLYRSAGGVSGGARCHARPAIDHLTAHREHSTVAIERQARKSTRKARTGLRVKSAVAEGVSAHQEPVDNAARAGERGPEMTSLSVVTPVGNKSPVTLVVDNQSASAGFTPPSVKPALQRRRWWLSYSAADVLVARMRGFDTTARSAVASALYRSHLDLEAWHLEGGGLTLVRALNVHAPTSGGTDGSLHRWDWPDAVSSPGGFLAMRLRHLPAQPETVGIPALAASVIDKLALGPGSSSVGRAAARDQFRQAQARRAALKRLTTTVVQVSA